MTITDIIIILAVLAAIPLIVGMWVTIIVLIRIFRKFFKEDQEFKDDKR